MIRKQIIATSGIDCQNQQLSLKILTEYAETLRSRSTATRMGINHDCTMLPVGKVLSGSLKRLDNGEIALEALIDDFADAFLPCKGPDGETLYYRLLHEGSIRCFKIGKAFRIPKASVIEYLHEKPKI